MELRQLRYAVAVADHLNFREASRALHVAQPSLKDASEHVDHAFLRTENIVESSVSRRHVPSLSATPGARGGPSARD